MNNFLAKPVFLKMLKAYFHRILEVLDHYTLGQVKSRCLPTNKQTNKQTNKKKKNHQEKCNIITMSKNNELFELFVFGLVFFFFNIFLTCDILAYFFIYNFLRPYFFSS